MIEFLNPSNFEEKKMNQFSKVVIIGHNRIPFARMNTAYKYLTNNDLLQSALSGLAKKYDLTKVEIGEIIGGAVQKSPFEANLIRESVQRSPLSNVIPCIDIQQACATGIQAVIQIAAKIEIGLISNGIACGVDSASNRPYILSYDLQESILNYIQEPTEKKGKEILLNMRNKDSLSITSINEPTTDLSMGEHCEATAKFFDISREAQDLFAYKSHKNLAIGYDDHFIQEMMTPCNGLFIDNQLRRDCNLNKLSSLSPSFDPLAGSLTAGNSTPFTDGAACLWLASESWAKMNNYPILARITHAETAAIQYENNHENLLLAPVLAGGKMLEKNGLRLQDFDYYEIHEAFAAQTLATIKIWEDEALAKMYGLKSSLGKINRKKLNIYGGSLAIGHPFAATGCRVVATMAKLLSDKGGKRGLISVCAARGQGVTMILERDS